MVYCNFKKAFLLTSLSPSCTGSQSGPESPVKSFSSPLNPYVILFPSVYLIYSPPAPQPGFCFPQIKIQILCIPLHQTPIFWGQSLSCPHPPPLLRCQAFGLWLLTRKRPSWVSWKALNIQTHNGSNHQCQLVAVHDCSDANEPLQYKLWHNTAICYSCSSLSGFVTIWGW